MPWAPIMEVWWMIKTLEDFEIGDILSDSLKKDKNIAALAYALTPIFQDILSKTKMIHMFEGIPDHLLDFVAFEEAAEFYDVNITNSQKRILIENAESIHKTKGTVAAIENVIAPFFSNGKVSEWFQYGGSPYHFLIYTKDHLQREQDIAKLFRMANKVKRQSTRLERVFFFRKDGVALQAVEGINQINIHPMTGMVSCGQWPEYSTLGKIIDSGITLKADIDKTIATYKVAGFFVNSEKSMEVLQKEYGSIIQLEQAPLDYSNVEYLMANKSLMVGKFRTGSKELSEGTQINVDNRVNIESTLDISIQEELVRSGQFFVGSKEELKRIQKEYQQNLEIGMVQDMSFVEYIATRDDLQMNFLVGSTKTFEQYTKSTSSTIEIMDNEQKTVREYKLTGQFYSGEGD